MKDNSVVMAPGASMPMPVIINPRNTAEYNREREERETLHPELTQVQWAKSKAKEGEAVELTARVKDIADGNPVTFQVWKEGQDPASGIAGVKISKPVEGGVAKAVFTYRHPAGAEPLKKKPKFFFTAHSAWCPYVKSGMLEVEGEFEVNLFTITGQPYKNFEYTITGPDKSEESGTVGDDGKIKKECCIPGDYHILFKGEEGKPVEEDTMTNQSGGSISKARLIRDGIRIRTGNILNIIVADDIPGISI
jgi:hypothetical protein